TGDTISAQGTALAFVERHLGDPDVVRPFDERLKRWGTPLALGPIGFYDAVTVGGTVVVCRPDFIFSGAPVYAWSGHRDDWTPAAAASPPATAIQAYGDVAWFRDQDQRLWAFGARERTYVHDAWPDRPGYATSGPGPAGSALQRLRVSLRGAP